MVQSSMYRQVGVDCTNYAERDKVDGDEGLDTKHRPVGARRKIGIAEFLGSECRTGRLNLRHRVTCT
jgi:hypothetical protein